MEIIETELTLPAIGGKARVLLSGTGAPVLLLHGNPENADHWRQVIAELSSTHQCIAPDLPGYGASPVGKRFDYSIDAQMAFVDELLEALEINEPVLLVVHDVGGPMGIAWAAANPAAVRSVLILNTVVFSDFEWHGIARRWATTTFWGRWRARVGMRTLGLAGAKLFKKLFWQQSPELSEGDVDRLVRSFALNDVAKNTTLLHFRAMLSPHFFSLFGLWLSRLTLAVPTHVLWGSQDPYIPDRYAFRFGHATVNIVPRGGHWLALTEPDRVAGAVHALENAARLEQLMAR